MHRSSSRRLASLLLSLLPVAGATLGQTAVINSPSPAPVHEVIFIDGGVKDASALAAHFLPGMEAVILQSGQDPVALMRRYLETRRELDAIRLISHARPGALMFSDRLLGTQELQRQGESFKAMGSSLKAGGSFMLYGCDLAAGPLGDAFIHDLARITGAHVAASTNKTGPAALGGDWALEAQTGPVATGTMFEQGFDYPALLPIPITGVDPGTNPIYVRPGGISNTWTFGPYNSSGNAAAGVPDGPNTVQAVGYWDAALTRGKIQYSTDSGGSWVDFPFGNTDYTTWLPIAGKTYRFVDTAPSDTTTSNSFFTGFSYVSSGSVTTTGQFVFPDNPPTDVFAVAADYWGAPSVGDLLVGLSKTDTGNSNGGVYAIDSQSIPNLFTVSGSSLSLGTGALPAVGTSATVTVHYYDYYQTNSAGTPIAGQGVSRTITLTHRANPVGFGSDVSVNTFKTNAQTNAQVAALSDGSFVVVWRSAGQDGETTSFSGIYGQKYTAAGVASGTEFAISPPGNGINESAPVVSALSGGRFVVAYTQNNTDNDVIYRVFAADGTKTAEASAASTTTGAQTAPWVTTLSTGNFVIAWIGLNGADAADIWVRQFDGTTGAAVASSELAVNTTQTGNQSFPGVAGLSNGNYAVSWRDPAGTGDVLARVMGTTAAVSGELAVINTAVGQNNPRIAALTGGGFVITYSESGRTEGSVVDSSSQSNIYARRFDNAGALQGSEFLVNTATYLSQSTPTISRLSGGGFVIAWSSNSDPDGSSGLFGRRFDAAGGAVDTFDFQLTQRRLGTQSAAVLAGLASNSFAAAWADSTLDGTANSGVGARVFTDVAAAPTPTVALSTGAVLANATTMTINGTLFDATTPSSNTIVFNDGAVGTVTAATATSLTVTFSTKPVAAGSLTAIVT
ncbi:MAG: hypothetical protein JWO08_1618, partial [Verrucomicrobiaceae bacterium]|nr:hypothetical protein [Verrucomicrobiaceae bacterium]